MLGASRGDPDGNQQQPQQQQVAVSVRFRGWESQRLEKDLHFPTTTWSYRRQAHPWPQAVGGSATLELKYSLRTL